MHTPLYLLAAFAVDAVVASSLPLETRQSLGCNLKQLKALQSSLQDPLLFCMWWCGNKSNQTPFTSLSKAQVDSTCRCIIATPTLGVSLMASVQISNPQVQGLPELQNSIAAPLPFCKVWSKISKKDASPFRSLSSIALSRVCTAILENPKLVAPKASGPSSSALVTSTKSSSSSKVTTQTTTSSTATTTTTTTTTEDTTTSTSPTTTPNTSPISAAQQCHRSAFDRFLTGWGTWTNSRVSTSFPLPLLDFHLSTSNVNLAALQNCFSYLCCR
ncbi:hypothetical protein KVT40_001309 [Elsinoe batatas]|uniref:Uncharacterized protein n=1 Tax=Elsinoe batatas TaxID=2601811 RepID=A0A8K0L6D6_9PEZI|nr:hypothetical protein KVT40_001309 [Elsinoe batatas]